MPGKKRPLAQAALEYLVTYGWALAMIATIIGILIFTAGGGISANTCTTFLTLICKGIGAEGDTLVLVLQNATGQKIILNPLTGISFDGKYGYAAIIYNGQTYRFEEVTIGNGEEFTVKGFGKALSNFISITYYEEETGLTKTVSSSVGTDAPEDASCLETESLECTFVLDVNLTNEAGDPIIVGLLPTIYSYTVPDSVTDYPGPETVVITSTSFSFYVVGKNTNSNLLIMVDEYDSGGTFLGNFFSSTPPELGLNYITFVPPPSTKTMTVSLSSTLDPPVEIASSENSELPLKMSIVVEKT